MHPPFHQNRSSILVRWSTVIVLLVAILWVWQVSKQQYQPPQPSTALLQAQAQWAQHQIHSYDLQVRLTTPTDPTLGGTLSFTILNDHVVNLACQPDTTTCRIYPRIRGTRDAVPNLFYLAQYGFQEAEGTTPGCLVVIYHRDYGFPQVIDTTRCAIAELNLIPVRLEVLMFTPLER